MSQPRILEAHKPLVSSFDPDMEARPSGQPSRRSWSVQQPQSAIEAACFAGFQHFTRERDPERARARFEKIPERTKQARADEFRVQLNAFVAAGGRI